MTTPTRAIAAVAALVLLLTGAGCGSGGGDASTTTSTQADQGNEGSVELHDGKIQVSDGEGSNFEVDSEGDADVPDGFPSDLEVPGTTKVLLANSTAADGKDLVSITVELDGSVSDVFAVYKDQLTGAGYAIDSDSDTSGTTDGEDYANLVGSKGDKSVVAIFATGADGVATANVSIQPKS